MNTRKLKLAWKYRSQLWKYRRVLRHRRQIAAVAVGCVVLGTSILIARNGILKVSAERG